MALPTAQLGSMASLNVPSYLPTQVIRKEPKLWEAALAQLLTQAAGQAVGRGVENVMSRDYAPEFGTEKAGLVEKFMSGPRANEKFMGMKAQTARDVAMEGLRNTNEQMAREYNAQQRTLADTDQRAFDLSKAAIQQRGANAEMRLRSQDAEANRRLQLMLAQIQEQGAEARTLEQGTRDIERENARRVEDLPLKRAEVAERGARTEKALEEVRASRAVRKLMEGRDGQSQVNPNIEKFRGAKTTSTPTTTSPTKPEDPLLAQVIGQLTPKQTRLTEDQLRQALAMGDQTVPLTPQELLLLQLSKVLQQTP